MSSMRWAFGEIDTFVGDLWELATQAVVVPVHCERRPAGQAALDLVRRAGFRVTEELEAGEPLELGEVVTTSAGDLPSDVLIHIAASTLARRPTIELLEDSLHRALSICQRGSFRSVAIPALYIDPGELSTTVVAKLIIRLAMESLEKSRFPGRIVLVVPSDYVDHIFRAELERVISEDTRGQ